MEHIRTQYPNMVLGPVLEPLDPPPPTSSRQESLRSKNRLNHNVAAVAAAAVAAVSPSNPYPVSGSTATTRAPLPSSVFGATTYLEDRARGSDPVRERRHTLVPFAEPERIRPQPYGDLPGHDGHPVRHAGARSAQAPQHLKPTRHPDATVAPVPAAAAVSHQYYPVSQPNGTRNAPPPPSLWMGVDSNARAGSSREGRPMLVPLDELQRASLGPYGRNRPENGARSARNTLPSPPLRLAPLKWDGSPASRPPRS